MYIISWYTTPESPGRMFSQQSEEQLTDRDALHYARYYTGVLPNLEEAVTLAFLGLDGAKERQFTRTIALYRREGDNVYVAFDDTDEWSKSIAPYMSTDGRIRGERSDKLVQETLRDELNAEYTKLTKKLGRPPATSWLQRNGYTWLYNKIFNRDGGWKAFKESRGEKTHGRK